MSGTDTVTVTVVAEFVDGGALGVFRTVVGRLHGAPFPTLLESLSSNSCVVGQVGNVEFSGKRLSFRACPLHVSAVAVTTPRVYVVQYAAVLW